MIHRIIYILTSIIVFSGCSGSLDFDAERFYASTAYAVPETNEITLRGIESSQQISVSSNCAWTFSADCDWLSASKSDDGSSLTISVTDNDSGDTRIGKVCIYIDGQVLNSIEVVQYVDSFVLKVKGLEYPMVFVEGGTFSMGSDDSGVSSNEKPAHQVFLSSYCIGKYEVTQELWEAVMGSNPSYFKGSRKPVEQVPWEDCQEFIRKLNSLTGKYFKLPTEAQWEYAARGGNTSLGYYYSGGKESDNVAWHERNSDNKTHDVGTKYPNELGLYDMSGNVWEWCSDWYGSYSYSSQTDPTGPTNGSSRIIRGGCWCSDAWYCRVSNRDFRSPDIRSLYIGLRLCL